MIESNMILELIKYLLNGSTDEGGWDSEPGKNKETNPLNTAEVLVALISVRHQLCITGLPEDYDKILHKGIKYLQRTQLVSGGWATGSAYCDSTTINSSKGNTVSTCFSIWALILNYKLIDKSSDIVCQVKKAIVFIAFFYFG